MTATSDSPDPVPEDAAPAPSESRQSSSAGPKPSPGSEPSRKLWEWITFLALAVLVYHLLALWYRWLRPDPDFLAFSTGVAELLAIASLLGLQTERGRKLVIRLDDLLGLGRVLNSRQRVCLAACLVAGLSVILLYVGSPVAANRLRHQGLDALEDGSYSRAITKFQRAASLVPRHAPTHYNLAAAYEAVHDYEQAISEYQTALELDDEFWPVYNNLGRLRIRALGDPDAALATLQAGQRRADDPLGATVIGSNIAWAYLEKGLPRAALAELEQVTGDLDALRGQGQSVEIYLARAYQLEALAHHALENRSEARRAWQDSLGYALAVAESADCSSGGPRVPPDCLDAFRFVAEAREELAKGTGGP
jgi:tetratricopeptide (TPR) repeat protein